ncbi:ribosome biogenesis factor YjgA [Hydromonas duriensis]|uniref:Dual-action ribosomal maturation protein DarP n=1 Tax=Hydromonas duriensis TaxID=1527608 RepID=A0A4R6YBB4_9BURK|nr:ribosome biogenesis factor YjgA [Hydromonas duriensis]TDR32846.1 ribosome-associated protein [Hydromonas duriensis]
MSLNNMTETHYIVDGSRERDGISKTARKAEMLALQKIGEALTDLSKDQLAQVPMSDKLREAIKEYKRLNSHGACRRQMQYIGKVMRDEDVEPIQAKLDQFNGVNAEATAKLHRIERLRLQIIEKNEALTRFFSDYPHADVQHIRALVRNARKEAELQKPPKSFRELFQVIKEVLEGKAMAASADNTELDNEDSDEL